MPIPHTPAMNMADEGVVEEMTAFKKAVRDMYHHNGMGVVFVETVMPSSLHKREQTQVECVPVPRECEMDCPMYFKQSLMEADEEWSVHRKLLPTDAGKGIRNTVPKEFAYFHVEWYAMGVG